MKFRLRNLKLTRVDRVAAGANPQSNIVLFKSAEELDPATNKTGATIEAMPETSAVEPAAEAVEATEENVEVTTESPAAEATEHAAEPVAASRDNEHVAKAEREALAKKLEVAEAEIAKMRDERERDRFTEIAKSELGSLPGEPEAIGVLLQKAKGALGEPEYQTLFRLLKAANAQTDTARLFAQFADQNEPEAKSFEEQVTEKAQALVDAGKARTVAQATAMVMADSPELRKAYGARQGI